MHKLQLEQIRKEVKSEMPYAVSQMDAATQDYFYKLAFQNKLLILRIGLLETNIDTLLNWHNGELKRMWKDNTGKTRFMERFIYSSKSDVDIIKLPNIKD